MLSYLRKILNSKFGAFIAMAGLIIVALAFALSDVTGLRSNLSGRTATGDTIAKIGDFAITPDDMRRRVEGQLEGYRQQQPTLTMAQFVAGGGLDDTLERYIDNVALQKFGEKHGIVVGKKAIDGQIASIPQFKGPDGKFDPKMLDRFLASQHLTVAQFREEIARVTVDQQLTAPTLGASQVPDKLARPYASLLLESRSGSIGLIPVAAVPKGPPPTDQEIAAYYAANVARFAVPERRSIRYAMASGEALKAQATPTEAEIAAAYKAKASDYAARETRSVTQVVLADKAAADALAAKVRQGTAIDAAAHAAGLEAAKLTKLDKPAYARQTDAASADAVFAVARGAVAGPLKAPLGWVVVQVDAIDQVPAKSLDQARPELLARLSAENTAKLLLDLRQKADTALNGNATFDEVVGDLKLAAATTPPLFADGRDPAKPTATPDPQLAQVVTAGFTAEPGDPPQLVPVGNDGSFAVVALDKVVAAAPAPLADVRARVAADIIAARGLAAARKIAADVLLKVNNGMPLAKALAGAGLPLPPTQPLVATRAQLAASRERVPPPLAMLFTIHAHSARVLPAPDGQGWFIVYLDTIVPGDASDKPTVLLGMRRDIGRTLGAEYIQQLSRAARREIGVSKNSEAIAKLRAELGGATQP